MTLGCWQPKSLREFLPHKKSGIHKLHVNNFIITVSSAGMDAEKFDVFYRVDFERQRCIRVQTFVICLDDFSWVCNSNFLGNFLSAHSVSKIWGVPDLPKATIGTIAYRGNTQQKVVQEPYVLFMSYSWTERVCCSWLVEENIHRYYGSHEFEIDYGEGIDLIWDKQRVFIHSKWDYHTLVQPHQNAFIKWLS